MYVDTRVQGFIGNRRHNVGILGRSSSNCSAAHKHTQYITRKRSCFECQMMGTRGRITRVRRDQTLFNIRTATDHTDKKSNHWKPIPIYFTWPLAEYSTHFLESICNMCSKVHISLGKGMSPLRKKNSHDLRNILPSKVTKIKITKGIKIS